MFSQPEVYRFVSIYSTVVTNRVNLPEEVVTDLVETWHLTGFSMLHLQYHAKKSNADVMRDAVSRISGDLSRFLVQCKHITVYRGSHPSFAIHLEHNEDWKALKSILSDAISFYELTDVRSLSHGDDLPVLQAMTDRIKDEQISPTVADVNAMSMNQILEIDNIVIELIDLRAEANHRSVLRETFPLNDFSFARPAQPVANGQPTLLVGGGLRQDF